MTHLTSRGGPAVGAVSSWRCCRLLDSHASEALHGITGWLPWLIVRYPV